MINLFADSGLRFRYPQTWKLEREDTANGWTVVVQSPETAFLMVTFDEDMPSTESMAQTALAALREDYPELEADDRLESLAGQPAVGHDIQFFSFDLTNTCWTRSFHCARGTVLVLCQTNDLELETHGAVLKAICASLEQDEDD
jgi:hypothetical protein